MSRTADHTGRSRGFTLVEMSIVLVIIGLIIGGILKGQEIIASARQKAVINQANAVRAAANTYFDRYRALPGDDPQGASIDGSLATGNGDGMVTIAANTPEAAMTTNVSASLENYTFFNSLIAAGLLNGGQVTASTAAVPAAAALHYGISALPASPISGAGLQVIYAQHGGDTIGATARTTHWLRLQKSIGAATAAAGANAVSPRTLANIDNQIDDGLPYTGGVREVSQAAGCPTGAAGAAVVRYAVSDDILCVPVFEIVQ